MEHTTAVTVVIAASHYNDLRAKAERAEQAEAERDVLRIENRLYHRAVERIPSAQEYVKAQQAEALITLIEGAVIDHDWQRIEQAIIEYRAAS